MFNYLRKGFAQLRGEKPPHYPHAQRHPVYHSHVVSTLIALSLYMLVIFAVIYIIERIFFLDITPGFGLGLW